MTYQTIEETCVAVVESGVAKDNSLRVTGSISHSEGLLHLAPNICSLIGVCRSEIDGRIEGTALVEQPHDIIVGCDCCSCATHVCCFFVIEAVRVRIVAPGSIWSQGLSQFQSALHKQLRTLCPLQLCNQLNRGIVPLRMHLSHMGDGLLLVDGKRVKVIMPLGTPSFPVDDADAIKVWVWDGANNVFCRFL